MTSVGSNFLCGRPHELPNPEVGPHMRVEPANLSPNDAPVFIHHKWNELKKCVLSTVCREQGLQLVSFHPTSWLRQLVSLGRYMKRSRNLKISLLARKVVSASW